MFSGCVIEVPGSERQRFKKEIERRQLMQSFSFVSIQVSLFVLAGKSNVVTFNNLFTICYSL